MASPTLPPDVISFEILTRTTPETLARCRLLSKDLNLTTYTSNFLRQHCENINATYGFLVQNSIRPDRYRSTFLPADENANPKTISLSFLPFPFQIQSSDKGMLVCINNKNYKVGRYIVCEPATQQWVKIPNPKTRYFTESIAIIVLRSKPNLRYMIVRLSRLRDWKHFYNLRAEVFDSDKWAWTTLKKDVVLPQEDYLRFKKPAAVSAHGGLHWLLGSNRVLSFDPNTVSFEIFPLPAAASEDGSDYHNCDLVAYQGRLALVCRKKEFMDLRVMKNHDNKIWGERERIGLIEELHGWNFVAFCSSDVALMRCHYCLGLYNFKEGGFNRTEIGYWVFPAAASIFGFEYREEERRGSVIRSGDQKLVWRGRSTLYFVLLFFVICLVAWIS